MACSDARPVAMPMLHTRRSLCHLKDMYAILAIAFSILLYNLSPTFVVQRLADVQDALFALLCVVAKTSEAHVFNFSCCAIEHTA